MRFFRPTLIVLMALMAAPVFAQDVQKGIEAFAAGDYAAALAEWRPLAARGNSDAQASLGLMYARGQGVPRDYGEAVKWFRQSAAQGHALAQNNLGVMYRHGYGVPQDYRLAVTMFRLSAAQGYALAQASLGAMYQNGDGIRRDPEKAYMWYTLAAEQGHQGANQARLSLGQLMSVDARWNALARAQDRQTRDNAARLPMQTRPAVAAPPQEDVARALPEKSLTEPPVTLAATGEVAVNSPAVSPAEKTPPTVDRAPWRIQLSSLGAQTSAEDAWEAFLLANPDLLHGMTLYVQQANLSEGIFYRVQAGPVADRATAVSLCNSFKSRDQDCLIVGP